MSLTENSLLSVVKKQYVFKIKAYLNIFYGLIGMQILAILFSAAVGFSSMSTGNNDISFTQQSSSGDFIILIAIVWAFIFAGIYASKNNRNLDFVFISNRISSNLSNIGFLVTVAIVGGVTTTLAGTVIRVVNYFLVGSMNILYENFFIPPQNLVVNIVAITMYIILFSSLGYLFGVLTQLNRAFVVLLPVVVIGSIIVENSKESRIKGLSRIIELFANETSLLMFVIKVIIAATLVFGVVILISNETEVR